MVSSENKYSTSVPDSPSIRQICNVFSGIDLEANDLDVIYDSDDNEPPPAACNNIYASEEAVLDGNELDNLVHEGTEDLSIDVYISVNEINKIMLDNLCSELKKRGILVSGLKKVPQEKFIDAIVKKIPLVTTVEASKVPKGFDQNARWVVVLPHSPVEFPKNIALDVTAPCDSLRVDNEEDPLQRNGCTTINVTVKMKW
eukprot:CAMPEP_0171311484 /NCGR_PEP_ID=MMETSP0816-20121228/21747_1 /TAXON_ID=420281 /ORGANISM="Proboscia inermis, Strain CCAP1064/1" /LENGTH=199 /DNA_ID=CAMNT_0011796295 /DNA_START=17 /DNA_END=613 /DNA_ORIENTATION=-